MAKIIDGKLVSAKVRAEVKTEATKFASQRGYKPKLTVLLVGDDPASQIYVRNKEKGCAEVGLDSEVRRFPAAIKQPELIRIIHELNADKSVHGILVQIPLPEGLSEQAVLDEIDPSKDVDGLHPLNMGKLLKGDDSGFVPCTPQGVIELILSTGINISGKEAAVIGRSNIVGKPMALLLMQKNATVTVCHSRTKNLAEVLRRAEILVSAVGSAKLVTKEMVRPGAVVIDVGTNRVDGKLVGDVDFESVKEQAGYLTPVPGGVGPMTIAFLLKNTLRAAQLLTSKQP